MRLFTALRCAMLVAPFAALAHSAAAQSCNAGLRSPSVEIALPGNPFQALPSPDGCWVFASMPQSTSGTIGIAVLRRAGGMLSLAGVLRMDSSPTGMAITHDGRTLVATAAQRLAFIDVAKLTVLSKDALLGYLDEPGRAPTLGRIYANITRDDKTLFVSDERAMTVTVIDFPKAMASHFAVTAIIGHIPVGNAPIALTFSNDETLMYTTSQVAQPALGWKPACRRESAPAGDTAIVNPPSVVHVIDVARAKTDPAHAVVSEVPAGCSAVRLVLSPAGDRAYVTARNNNALLVFDTGRLRSDPAHALIGRVGVGTAPVGIAVIDGGKRVLVTNSNRFAGGANDRQYLTVVDATRIADGDAAVVGSIAAGGFPREMRITPDGGTLLLTNFASGSIQAIDLTRLPMEAPKR